MCLVGTGFSRRILTAEGVACRRGRLQSWCNGLDDERHIFSTVVACLSGFRGADRARMRELIVRGGGAVTQDLTANCTHLITRELRGDKCRKAMDMTSNIFIVPAMWLWRSLQSSRKEDEDSYCACKPLKDLTLSPSTDPLLQHGHEVRRASTVRARSQLCPPALYAWFVRRTAHVFEEIECWLCADIFGNALFRPGGG